MFKFIKRGENQWSVKFLSSSAALEGIRGQTIFIRFFLISKLLTLLYHYLSSKVSV